MGMSLYNRLVMAHITGFQGQKTCEFMNVVQTRAGPGERQGNREVSVSQK